MAATGARALLWPQARAGAAGTTGAVPNVAVAAPPPFLDAARFAAGFGPEAATRMGFRLALRALPVAPAESARLVRIAGCDVAGGIAWLAGDAALADQLQDRLFGAPALRRGAVGPIAGDVALPCGASSSWQGFARLMGQGLKAGLAAAGLAAGQVRLADELVPRRAAPGAVWFAAEAGNGPGWLVVALEPADPPPVPGDTRSPAEPLALSRAGAAGIGMGEGAGDRPATPAWQQRAAALARAIELPTAVQIAELQLPLGDVVALEVGALVPLERPARLMLSVDGKAWQPLAAPPPDVAGEAEERRG